MANASFTRDEVILALDVLYSNGGIAPEPESVEIQQLSRLLHRLPIHPVATRKKDFRTPTGVQAQISRYQHRYENMVGVMFYKIDSEFENRYDELHAIAKAIRRNVAAFEETIFGDPLEGEEFPEGILLGHLHRIVETRDSAKLVPGKRCEICQIDTSDIYPGYSSLMSMHLAVPITELDGNRRYQAKEFITVCPNCHAALHRRRPWLTKENCGELLC